MGQHCARNGQISVGTVRIDRYLFFLPRLLVENAQLFVIKRKTDVEVRLKYAGVLKIRNVMVRERFGFRRASSIGAALEPQQCWIRWIPMHA
ncbi:MAG TPA: hypothetical protein VFR12_06655, partial [Pyrinomonadaceae bacterium]|nr:hypothetical protein [Pyrinomonadaceae bacterium]